jgi:HlyD family secretion protein
METIKKTLGLFKNKKNIIIASVCILLILFFIFRDKNGNQELFTLTTENLAFSGITLGGTVIAQDEVMLSFQNSGRVSQVVKQAGDRVQQGDVIVRLDSASISANLLKAQADLDAERAKLEEIRYQETVTDSGVATKRAQLLQEMKNSYRVAEDAVMNKTDSFFNDPRSFYPRIFPLFDSSSLRQNINEQRYIIGVHLKEWSTFSNSLKDDFTESDIEKVKNNVKKVQAYIDLVAMAVNQFEAQSDNPLRTQTMIDMYKANTSTARTSLNNALTSIIEKQETLRPNSSQVPYQESRVKSAQATVQSYQADLEKTIIRAPFTGLITRQDAKVGMNAFADQEIITMISDSNYGIEAYIPEIYISQVQIGTKAKVTLTSYGTVEKFDATITYLDPAASLRDGVASYKIELIFDTNDDRITSGMTADIELLTEQTVDSFWIPSAAIIDQNGASYVKVKVGSGVELRKIELGERTPEETEVLRGLIVGDQIIIENK